jgi:hypothetical protein
VKRTKGKAERPVVVRSLMLTRADGDILQRLSASASGYTGRAVSGSAIVRALLRHAERQGLAWGRAQLFPLVGTEMSGGVMWGRKR